MLNINYGGPHYYEYIEGRKNEKRKKKDPSLDLKEMLLGIARNSVSVKVKQVDGLTDI